MRIGTLFILGVACATAGWGCRASEQGNLSLVRAQSATPATLTATGRMVSTKNAKLSSRLGGRIVEWGKDAAGGTLDVGTKIEESQMVFRIERSTYEAKVKIAMAAVQQAAAVLKDLRAGVREEKKAALRAALREVEARIEETRRDVERFRRLVQEDQTVPPKRLEEVQLQLKVQEAQRDAAKARVAEADAGSTETEIAVAEARLVEAKTQQEAAELDLRDTEIRAPFSGMLTRRFRDVGDYINSAPVTEVVELVSVDDLEAELRLPETYIRKLRPGKTEVTLQSLLLSDDLKLHVGRIIDAVDPGSGTFAFRIPVRAKQRGDLLPGAFVQGTVHLQEEAQGVLVPIRAVVKTKGEAYVFVAENGKMRRRDVKLGDQLTEAVNIKSGLKPGEYVILGSTDKLQEGASLPSYLVTP